MEEEEGMALNTDLLGVLLQREAEKWRCTWREENKDKREALF